MKRARIVIGASYGDEGKGTVVAKYAKESSNVLNILTNGGSQRGHSVVTEKGEHTFQHFGSGTYFNADNYYSSFFILNPMQFVKEWHELVIKPKTYRDMNCLWSTPYDMIANAIEEEVKNRHASCRMGIWNTMTRSRELCTCTFDRFMTKTRDDQYLMLNSIKKYYEKLIKITGTWKAIWESPYLIEHYLNDCWFMYKNTIAVTVKDTCLKTYDNFIFENGQGLLLKDTGKNTYDTTPSDTGITYSLDILKSMQLEDLDVIAHYVTRPYLTRHGDGHVSGAMNRNMISAGVSEDRTNHYNDAQGEFRYGKLDIDALKQRITDDSNGHKYVLEVTHCDEMDRISEFKKNFENIKTTDKNLI